MAYYNNGIPAPYTDINVYNGTQSPSTVHVNTALSRFFQRYLLEEALSVFKFNIPDTWDLNFFRYCLFIIGHIGVVNTDKYGVICMNGMPYGRGLYYQPTNYLIANPLLQGTLQPRIGVDCEVIRMQPDWCGMWDLVNFYGDMMALSAEAAGINIINSKLAYVFLAKNKAMAESMKKMYDQIHSGNPAVFADKNLTDEDGNASWMLFNQNLKNTYIAPEIMSDLHRWKNLFLTEIGIPNANYEKSERLITNEVNANNTETRSKAELWLEQIQDGMRRVNNMFDLELSVSLRFDIQEQEEMEVSDYYG